MSGLIPNGLPVLTLPFSGLEKVALDTNLSSGQAPQSAGVTTQQMTAIGLGSVLPLTDATTIAVDASKGSYFSVTIGATGRTLTISNPSPGQEVLIEVVQDATGSRTITTWTNWTWAGGTAPTLTTAANAVDLVRATYNATAGKWRGETVGKAYA